MVGLQLELTFTVRDRQGRMLPPEDLHGQGERLMGALLDLERCNDGAVVDPATSSDAADGTVTVDLLVKAAAEEAAVGVALGVCRTAIHAIGGSTPSWPADPVVEPEVDFLPADVRFAYV